MSEQQQYPKMNPEVKRQWIEELRSGRWVQGKEQLAQFIDDNYFPSIPLEVPRYCCLGVLCTLPDSPQAPTDKEMPEEETIKWAGLTYDRVEGGGTYEFEGSAHVLAKMNDDGKTFKEIANWIEENL